MAGTFGRGELDESIFTRCLAGDRAAQRELYERHRRRVFHLVIRLVGLPDAADVCQQVFLQVFRRLSSFRGEASFSTWLYRITVNECLQFRRRRVVVTQSLPDEVEAVASAENSLEQGDLLDWAFRQIDEPLKQVFLLREAEGLSYGEIASVLGIPAGTVASQLNRARAELRAILEREVVNP